MSSREPYGAGGESKVFLAPDGQTVTKETYPFQAESSFDKVTQERKQRLQRNTIIAEYYLAKVLHLLYPTNFPDIHFVGIKRVMEGRFAGTGHFQTVSVHQAIPLDGLSDDVRVMNTPTTEMVRHRWTSTNPIADHSTRVMQDPKAKEIFEINQRYDLNLDTTFVNFAFTPPPESDAYFVDRIPHQNFLITPDRVPKIELLRQDIEDAPHDPEVKARCYRLLDRYEAIIDNMLAYWKKR